MLAACCWAACVWCRLCWFVFDGRVRGGGLLPAGAQQDCTDGGPAPASQAKPAPPPPPPPPPLLLLHPASLLLAAGRAGELVTRANGDASDRVGRQVELGQRGIVDPQCRLIGLHLYDGLFKVGGGRRGSSERCWTAGGQTAGEAWRGQGDRGGRLGSGDGWGPASGRRGAGRSLGGGRPGPAKSSRRLWLRLGLHPRSPPLPPSLPLCPPSRPIPPPPSACRSSPWMSGAGCKRPSTCAWMSSKWLTSPSWVGAG